MEDTALVSQLAQPSLKLLPKGVIRNDVRFFDLIQHYSWSY